MFLGLQSQLIYQARPAVFPGTAVPKGLQGACRWWLQPWLFIGTDLTDLRKRLQERGREPAALPQLW